MEARVQKTRLFHWIARILVLICVSSVVIAHAQGNVSLLPDKTQGSFEFSGRMMYYPLNPVWYPTLQAACEGHAAYLATIRSDFAGAYCVKSYVVPANYSGYWFMSIAFPNWHLWSGELAVVTEPSVNVRVACPSGYGGGSSEWDYTTTPRSMVAVCGRTAFCPANATGRPANYPNTCTCNDGYAPDPTGTSCEPENYTIELDRREATIEPISTTAGNGKASQEFTATVKSNGTPKSGAQVSIRAEVKEKTGGHDHHDKNRPKGTLSRKNGAATSCEAVNENQICLTGTTGDDGTFTFSFTSSQVSGEHTLTATCELCGGNQDRAEVKVMVEGLIPIPASQSYALTDSQGNVIGGEQSKPHHDNHYLTANAIGNLEKLAKLYKNTTNPGSRLYLNDASLKWGGLFDVGSTSWRKPHTTHRLGVEIDIRAAAAANGDPVKEGAIPFRLLPEVWKDAREIGIKAELHCMENQQLVIGMSCYWLPDARHFHVNLR